MKTKRFLFIIGIALAALVTSLIPVVAEPWSSIPVDGSGGSGNVGFCSSLALNTAGQPCISYYNSTNGDLMYAVWNGAGWQRQIVDSTGDVGLYSSLVLAAGQPSIAYYDNTNSDLKYASWGGTNWQLQTADNDGRNNNNVGRCPSLVLDAGGQQYITYVDATTGSLMYVCKQGAYPSNSWKPETIATGVTENTSSSLAFDSTTVPHVSYSSGGQLYYATRDAKGIWSTIPLATETGMGPSTSLVFYNGNPYIAYTSSEGVKIVWSNGGVWQTPEYVDTRSVASSLSLVMDANGPHLSYCDSNGIIKYAVKINSIWTIEPVATGCTDSSTSLKLISADAACISYTQAGTLMCATRNMILPVRLQQFSAQRKAGNVLLRWRCSEAADAAGFYLYRAETARGPYVRVNSRLLAANAKTFWDRDASLSGRCYYKLEIVDSAGNRTVYGPERVQ